MSVASQIQRIKDAVADAYDSVEEKGGTLPATENVANLATAIDSIQTGSQPVISPLTVTANGTYTAPSGTDGYSPVTVNVTENPAPGLFPDIHYICDHDDPVADGLTTTVFAHKMIWAIRGTGETITLPNGGNYRFSDGSYVEGASSYRWTIPSSGYHWIIAYQDSEFFNLNFNSSSYVGVIVWMYIPTGGVAAAGYQNQNGICAIDGDITPTANNIFYNNNCLLRVRGRIIRRSASVNYATLAMSLSYNIREYPSVIDMRGGTYQSEIGNLVSVFSTTVPRQMFARLGSVNISGCWMMKDRSCVCVFEDGVAVDHSANPSNDYGFCNNINQHSSTGTITLSAAQQALFTQSEWESMTTMLVAKGWNLAPAWPT